MASDFIVCRRRLRGVQCELWLYLRKNDPRQSAEVVVRTTPFHWSVPYCVHNVMNLYFPTMYVLHAGPTKGKP